MSLSMLDLSEKLNTFGCEELGRLSSVLIHPPYIETLKMVCEENLRFWLYDKVPEPEKFCEEYFRYQELLRRVGVRTFLLSDYVYQYEGILNALPNLIYLNNIAVVTSHGSVISKMAFPGRKREDSIVKEALGNLGIPCWIDFNGVKDVFEGFSYVSPDTILIADTERHEYSTIHKFIQEIISIYKEVIYVCVPKNRRFMHSDTVFNRIRHDLALAYLPAFKATFLFTHFGVQKIDFVEYMNRKGIGVINVSASEQKRLACSFLLVDSGVIIQYDTAFEKETRLRLARKGVELIFFHPEALLAGGGSLKCLTLELHREVTV